MGNTLQLAAFREICRPVVVDETRQNPPGRVDRRRLMARRRPRDERRRRVAIAATALFLFLLAGAVVAIYVVTFVRPPGELVVRVNDVSYDRADMVRLLRVRQRGTEFLGGQFNSGTDVFRALQILLENEIIAQSAPRLGISVSEEEVDADIFALLVASPVGKTEKQFDLEFRERYGSYLTTVQLSEDEHRDLVRRGILRDKLTQFVGESVPTVAEQVHLYRLVVSPDDELDIIRNKYDTAKGINKDPELLRQVFKLAVREFSRDDPELVRRGGDLGWIPEGVLEDYDNVFFDLPIGDLSADVSDRDVPRQRFIFMVSERQEAREVDSRNHEVLKTRALQDWLNNERQNHDVYAVFGSDVYAWIIQQLGLTTTRTPEPAQSSPFGS
jgi:parvulin-like peptidyl-prolyl isomerase